jgi:hypothetical protein
VVTDAKTLTRVVSIKSSRVFPRSPARSDRMNSGPTTPKDCASNSENN